MEIRIVQAESAHNEGIERVRYGAWLDTYPNESAGITKEDVEHRFAERFTETKLAKRRADLESQNDSKRFYVALDGETVVGFCKVLHEDTHNTFDAIYVLPEYHRRGIGRALWEKATEFLDPQKDTTVAVATYNEKAIAFYTKLGFIDTGERFEEERMRMKSGANIPQMTMRYPAKQNGRA